MKCKTCADLHTIYCCIASIFKAASPFFATIHHTIKQAGASFCHAEERVALFGACITLSGQSCMHFSIGDIAG